MATIMMLRAGDEVPGAEPRKYRSSHGYVRLRWYVGDGVIVEVYEHRVRDGVVAGGQVHHLNGVRDDNRRENLVYCDSAAEHRAHHRRIDKDDVVARYQSGAPMTLIARELGLDCGYASRLLRRCGVAIRPRQKVDPDRFRRLANEGLRTADLAAAFGVSYSTAAGWRTRLGLPGRPGRPRRCHSGARKPG